MQIYLSLNKAFIAVLLDGQVPSTALIRHKRNIRAYAVFTAI